MKATPSDGSRGRKRGVLDSSVPYIVLVALADRTLRRSALSFLLAALRRFFLDQYAHASRVRRGVSPVEVRNVEHPLDAGIPIRYEKLGVYLTFVKLWISAGSYFRRRVGPSFNEPFAAFMDGMKRCYVDANGVYGRCLSTTRRPGKAPDLRYAWLYAVDPHLFCVPSLHVLVVCYSYWRMAEALEGLGLRDEYSGELAELKARAVEITESILYVRQHSVNCIPAALSMLGSLVPSYGEEEARAFLASLFEGADDVGEEGRAAAIAYMTELYGRLTSVGPGSAERYDAIVEFLLGYGAPAFADAEGGAASAELELARSS